MYIVFLSQPNISDADVFLKWGLDNLITSRSFPDNNENYMALSLKIKLYFNCKTKLIKVKLNSYQFWPK